MPQADPATGGRVLLAGMLFIGVSEVGHLARPLFYTFPELTFETAQITSGKILLKDQIKCLDFYLFIE